MTILDQIAARPVPGYAEQRERAVALKAGAFIRGTAFRPLQILPKTKPAPSPAEPVQRDPATARRLQLAAYKPRKIERREAEYQRLKHASAAAPGRWTVDRVARLVAYLYGVEKAELISDSRQRGLIAPRQAAMYFCLKKTRLSFLNIGARFGRDHTTVIHGARKHCARHGLPFPRDWNNNPAFSIWVIMESDGNHTSAARPATREEWAKWHREWAPKQYWFQRGESQ